MRILIVEDQPAIAAIMTKLVINAGHEASPATDGYSAVRLAAERPPEVVLLDIEMLGIDGYETARRLRDRHGNQFPIFAVTAAVMDTPLGNQSGFSGVFAKPFSIKKLKAIISQLS